MAKEIIKIGTEVTLSDTEQLLAKAIAKRRYQKSREAGVHNSRKGPQSDEATDKEGMGGEIAFCKLFNVYPDLSIEVKSSAQGTDKGDCILHVVGNGTVDVKTTIYPDGKLLAAPWKSKEGVDLYALMTGKFPTYTFKGFMTSADLMVEERYKTFSKSDAKAYVAHQRDLKEIKIEI